MKSIGDILTNKEAVVYNDTKQGGSMLYKKIETPLKVQYILYGTPQEIMNFYTTEQFDQKKELDVKVCSTLKEWEQATIIKKIHSPTM